MKIGAWNNRIRAGVRPLTAASVRSEVWPLGFRRRGRLGTLAVLLIMLAPLGAVAQMTVGGGYLYVGNENTYMHPEVDVEGIEPIVLREPLTLANAVYVSKDAYRDPARLSIRAPLTSARGYVGHSPNGEGMAVVYGPTGSWTLSGLLTVGHAGWGYLRIEQGGVVHSTGAIIGVGYYGKGEATVTGFGSTWINAGDFDLGVDSGGKLYVDNRAVLHCTGHLHVGTGWSSRSSRAALHVRGGARLMTGTAQLEGGRSEAFVQGDGSLWDVRELLEVGTQARAYLFVENGGALVVNHGRVSGTSRVYVRGLNSRWEATGTIEVGAAAGPGSVLVEQGARMTAKLLSIGPGSSVRASQGGTIAADVQLDGGLLRLESTTCAFGTLQLGQAGSATPRISRLEFVGDGPSVVTFQNSDRISWMGTLRIEGYLAGQDSLRILGNGSYPPFLPLTGAQLAQIWFADYNVSAQIDADGYVTPAGL